MIYIVNNNDISYHDGKEAMEVGRPGHVDDGVELREVRVPIQMNNRGQSFQSRSLYYLSLLAIY